MLLIGLFAIRFFIKMLTVPEYILIPIVFVLCVIRSYVVNYSIFDAVIMISFGVFGFLLKKKGGQNTRGTSHSWINPWSNGRRKPQESTYHF